MPRTVSEWIGKTDDSVPPPRVKLRILRTHNEADYLTGIPFREVDKIEFDHIVAICNGGENRESNLAPTLADKHKEKTAPDVAERATTDSRAAARFGIKPKSRGFRGWRNFKGEAIWRE